MRSLPSPKPRRRGLRPAFTLIETAMATMIVSVAVVSMCGLLAAGTAANLDGTEMTTAVNLAGSIHELVVGHSAAGAPGEVIGPNRIAWDLNDVIFSPAVDSRRRVIPGYDSWRQEVRVQTVDQSNVGVAAPEDRDAPSIRLTVSIYHNGRYVYSGSWLMTDDDPT